MPVLDATSSAECLHRFQALTTFYVNFVPCREISHNKRLTKIQKKAFHNLSGKAKFDV